MILILCEVVPSSTVALYVEGFKEEALVPWSRLRGFHHRFRWWFEAKNHVKLDLTYDEPLINAYRPWQIVVGRLVSIKNWWFSGSMLIYQAVIIVDYCWWTSIKRRNGGSWWCGWNIKPTNRNLGVTDWKWGVFPTKEKFHRKTDD